MSKQRVNTGFGPLVRRSTVTGNSGWIQFGPFIGNTLSFQAVFSATSAGQTCKIQGTLTTASTRGVITLVTRSSTQTAQLKSTSALIFTHVRFGSTALKAGSNLTMIAAAVP